MTETWKFLRLMTWLSPTFPVGGFNYSHGLEQAVACGLVSDKADLEAWISELLAAGSLWNDAVLLVEAWRRASGPAGGQGGLLEIAELAEALAGSAERHLETMNQGSAFLRASQAWPSPVHDILAGGAAWPVAVGAVTGAAQLPLADVIAAFLHAFALNQVQAALRLMPLGQTGGVTVMAGLETVLAVTARRAAFSKLEDLGSAALNAEIMAMAHETLSARLFAS